MDRQPGPAIRPGKKWRDRLIAGIPAKPTERAGVFVDESWSVLWAHRTTSWAEPTRPRRIPKNKSWKRGERPPSCASYAKRDVAGREVSGEWHPTRNQGETWAFREGVIAAHRARGARSLVVFWDHGPWHVAAGVRQKVADHNRAAKREGGVHVMPFFLPVKAPWLMPLEGVFGQTKRAVGGVDYDDLPDLQSAVERRFARRQATITRPTYQSKAPTDA